MSIEYRDILKKTPQEAAETLISDFGIKAYRAVLLARDNTPMYCGNLNPKWKFWEDVIKIIGKSQRGEYDDWISIDDKMPEEFPELLIHPEDELTPVKTATLLVITDIGSVTDNMRLVMNVDGRQWWDWFMGYDGEEITHWKIFHSPVQ